MGSDHNGLKGIELHRSAVGSDSTANALESYAGCQQTDGYRVSFAKTSSAMSGWDLQQQMEIRRQLVIWQPDAAFSPDYEASDIHCPVRARTSYIEVGSRP